jgi:tagatose 6-phosphate kinase
MIKQLGGSAQLVGFAGGSNGQLLEQMLDTQGVEYQHVTVEGETRICQTLVEAGNPETTELVEEMPPLGAHEWEKMAERFKSLDLSGMVAISGKLPAGAPVDAYAQIVEMVAEQGGQAILDAQGDPMLLALEYKPHIVKINDTELFEAVGGNDLMESCRRLIQRGARAVLITRGSRSAYYLGENQAFELIPPEVKAINAVGSGDAVTAGLAVALNDGMALPDALVKGMACGAANTLSLVSGAFWPDDVERLRGEVGIEPV